MLLLVTLTHPRIFYKVVNAKLYHEHQVKLPAGQYVFRKVVNPVNPELKDWLILEQPQLISADFSANDIIGACYEYMLFWCQAPSFFGFNDMIISMEELSAVAVVNDQTEYIAPPPASLAKIIHLPQNYPPFARVPKRHQFRTYITTPIIIGRRRWNPAARRIMSCS